ncbi:hypothetical protein CAT58_08380 [Acinetobacter pittii]|nr:hypothetical protein CAT58_08380 [Acinetobacter pittii]
MVFHVVNSKQGFATCQSMLIVSTAVRSGAELKTLTARKDGKNFQKKGDRGSKVEKALSEKTAPPSNFCVVKSP